jgi:hypothetical protein
MSPPVGNNQQFVELVAADTITWYRKGMLTRLYRLPGAAAMGVEWTSGFGGSIRTDRRPCRGGTPVRPFSFLSPSPATVVGLFYRSRRRLWPAPRRHARHH